MLAAIVVGGCALAALAPAAASATRLEIQFQAPAAGAIELIAVPYQVHFNGKPPPLHPAGLHLSLPRSGPPHSYGLLAGELRTRVHGHTATYVLLIEALRALTSASGAAPAPLAPQTLVSEDENVTPIIKGVKGTLHPTAGRLVIDNDTEAQREAFQHTLAQNGVSNPSAANFHIGHFEGHAFHWDTAKQRVVWDDSWITVGLPQSGVQVQLVKIEKTLGKPFKLAKPFEVPELPAPPHEEPTVQCPPTAVVGSTFAVTVTGVVGTYTLISTTPASTLPSTTPFTIGSTGSTTDSIRATAPGNFTFQAVGPKGEKSNQCATQAVPAG